MAPTAMLAQVSGTPSELSQKAVSMTVSPVIPSKGVVTNSADLLRDPAAAITIDNLQMLRQGVWTSQGIGYTTTSASLSSGDPPQTFAVYRNNAGTVKGLITMGGGATGAVNIWDPDTGVTTFLGNIGPNGCLRSYGSDNVYFTTPGTAGPTKWDGVLAHTITNLAGWPKTFATRSYANPKFIEGFYNRMVYAGFSTFPNTILISNFGNAETFTQSGPQAATDAGAIDVPKELGEITGLASLKLSNTSNASVLIIGCKRGVAVLNGTDALTFAVTEATQEFGILNNRNWVRINNDLYFVASDGIRKFSSISTGSILANNAVSFPVRELIAANANIANDLSYAQSFCVRHPGTQEVHFFIPTTLNHTGCDKDIVMNYNSLAVDTSGEQRDIGQPIFSTKSGMRPMFGAGDYYGTMYSGGYTGFGTGNNVYKHYDGDFYTDATRSGALSTADPIKWTFVSPVFGANNPAENCSCRKIEILTDGGAQQFTASAYIIAQQNDNSTYLKLADTAVLSQSAPLSSPDLTTLGVWTGPSATTTIYPKFLSFIPRGSGRFWILKLSGTTTAEKISFTGLTTLLTVGGLKQ